MYSHRMSALRPCVLVVCVVLACLVGARPATAASIRGIVTVTGAVTPKKLPVTIDQYVCGTEKPGEDLVVSGQGRVKNAVVWLQTPPPGAAWPSEPTKVEMDQKGCVFVPRVVIVPAGGTVEFLNSDRLLHNLHSASHANPTFNRTQPRGRVIPVTFSKPKTAKGNAVLNSGLRRWVAAPDSPSSPLANK